MGYLDVSYASSYWCIFIDSSKSSLKDALMYKHNLFLTLPIAYANVKEDRSSIGKLLELIKYNAHTWLIMCDLKVLNLIMKLKCGYSKYPCFYCMFDSRQSTLDFNPTHIWSQCVDFDISPLVPVERLLFLSYISS